MGGGHRGKRCTSAQPPRRPRTHAGSAPEGDAAFDEEHPHVAAADHEQHAAEAQVDEADEDLDRLREAEAAQPGAPHRPLPAPEESVQGGPCSPSQLLATEKQTLILFF